MKTLKKTLTRLRLKKKDWFDYIRRSTADAIDRMDHAKIRCWNKTHKKMKWNLALRIATSPSERWVKKAAEWNPEMSSKYRTSRNDWKTKKRDGKMTSTTSSNKIMMRQRLKKLVKEGFKTITGGSALQLTEKNGFYLKKSTFRKNAK